MRRSLTVVALFISLLSPGALPAQKEATRMVFITRTFPLQSLSPGDAKDLVQPYTFFVPGAGVFEANALRAITVRGTSEMLAQVDSILRVNDHPRRTLVMRFQLIAASDSAVRDTAISAVVVELRSLFKFAGYRLLSQGTAMANEGEWFTLTMAGVNGEVLKLRGHVVATRPSDTTPIIVVDGVRQPGGKGTAQLFISLERTVQTWLGGVATSAPQTLLSTGLTVPLGQTVVLGSAAYGAPIPAIILAVRPEVAGKP